VCAAQDARRRTTLDTAVYGAIPKKTVQSETTACYRPCVYQRWTIEVFEGLPDRECTVARCALGAGERLTQGGSHGMAAVAVTAADRNEIKRLSQARTTNTREAASVHDGRQFRMPSSPLVYQREYRRGRSPGVSDRGGGAAPWTKQTAEDSGRKIWWE